MKRVLMIEHFLPGNTYSLELCKELRKYEDLTLMCTNAAQGATEDIHSLCKLYGSGKKGLAAMAAYGKSLLAICKEAKKGYDVIHVQTMKMAKYEVPMYMHLKKKMGPLVYTAHNVLSHEHVDGEQKALEKFYQICDVLITHNEHTKRLLIEDFHVEPSKICVIPHGVYNDLINSQSRDKDGKTVFLMFGNVRRYKGLDILLKAIALIPDEERKKVRFIIAGTMAASDMYCVQLSRELRVDDCVEFIPRKIEYEKLPELFMQADACIFPYREIYGSGALMMAYSFCKPVIASDVPTFIEETNDGKTGLLFKSENPASLADALCRYTQLTDDDISEFGDNIKKLVANKYNWHLSGKKTADIYERISS